MTFILNSKSHLPSIVTEERQVKKENIRRFSVCAAAPLTLSLHVNHAMTPTRHHGLIFMQHPIHLRFICLKTSDGGSVFIKVKLRICRIKRSATTGSHQDSPSVHTMSNVNSASCHVTDPRQGSKVEGSVCLKKKNQAISRCRAFDLKHWKRAGRREDRYQNCGLQLPMQVSIL